MVEAMPSDLRTDPWLGTRVHVVGSRQGRPNLPSGQCPFCPGGVEAPEPYRVRWFPNRWPPMEGHRCEVVVYSPRHDDSLSGLDDESMDAVVDLWTERTAALGSRDDVATVLIFENHGREVGATIDHPHGQIYAFDHVPERTRLRLRANWNPESADVLVVDERDGWRTFVPSAPVYPVSLQVAPVERLSDLPAMNVGERAALGRALRRARRRIEALFGDSVPTMSWINQRPFDNTFHDAWFNVEIVSPWRSSGVQRYIAAAEVATGEYFNPVVPEELAERLRAVAP